MMYKIEGGRWIFAISMFTCLMALAFLSNPDVARAQNYRNCAWPIEISPEGFGNAVLPESFARAFIIPLDKQYDTMTIKGTYPNVRYFSFVVHEDKTPSDIAGRLYDAQIVPDPGSVNPFVQPENTTPRTRSARWAAAPAKLLPMSPDRTGTGPTTRFSVRRPSLSCHAVDSGMRVRSHV